MHRANDGTTVSVLRRIRHSCGWLLIAAGFVPLTSLGARAQSPGGGESLVNHRAPEFARHSINGHGIDGQRIKGHGIDLEHYRGKVVLLNFWATWCAPCLAEMPAFSSWQSKYGPEGLQVVGISMDDDAAPVRKLLAQLNPSYPIAMGDVRLGRLYGGVLGLPLTFLIDRRGVVRARYQGETALPVIEKEMRVLLDSR